MSRVQKYQSYKVTKVDQYSMNTVRCGEARECNWKVQRCVTGSAGSKPGITQACVEWKCTLCPCVMYEILDPTTAGSKWAAVEIHSVYET